MSLEIPRAGSGIARSASSRRAQGSVAVSCQPFSRSERIALWLIAAAFVVPVPIWEGRIVATEIAMSLFVLVAHKWVRGLARLVPVLVVMAVPLVFGFRFPVRWASKPAMIQVYAKLALFVCFIYILVERCGNGENVSWLAKRVILPASFVLCLSALVDHYTKWPFFVDWRRLLGTDYGAFQRLATSYSYRAALVAFVDEVGESGFAPRTMDIIPWALLGLTTAYWLKQGGQMRASRFLGIALVLLGAAFSMPKRSAVLTISSAVLAFIIIGRSRADRRWKFVLALLAISGLWVASITPSPYRETSPGVADYREGSEALPRLLTYGLIEEGEHRYIYFVEQLHEFRTEPRLLLFGSGWDFGAGVWVKPHNTYIALIVGGGLVSLIPLIIVLGHLFRRSATERTRSRPCAMGTVLLIGLCVEMAINGYLTYNLGVAASILAIWVAWSAILYRNAPLSVATPEASCS